VLTGDLPEEETLKIVIQDKVDAVSGKFQANFK